MDRRRLVFLLLLTAAFTGPAVAGPASGETSGAPGGLFGLLRRSAPTPQAGVSESAPTPAESTGDAEATATARPAPPPALTREETAEPTEAPEPSPAAEAAPSVQPTAVPTREETAGPTEIPQPSPAAEPTAGASTEPAAVEGEGEAEPEKGAAADEQEPAEATGSPTPSARGRTPAASSDRKATSQKAGGAPSSKTRAVPSRGASGAADVELPPEEIQGELEKPEIFFLMPHARDQSDEQMMRARIHREVTRPLIKDWLEEEMLLK